MKNELQRLSDLLELENTLEYKARQQAYAVAKDLTVAWIGFKALTGKVEYDSSVITEIFNTLTDQITERMISHGKALEQTQAAESNTTQVAHS